MTGNRVFVVFAAAALGVVAMRSSPAYAHCDGMDGPVVKSAQEALAKNDVNLVLIWVGKSDEPEIRRAFDRSVAVRTLGPQAKELAEMSFFETLVRLHRAGEGAAFTGLKPAGRDLGPAIPAADHALKSGHLDPLANLLVERVRVGLLDRFKRATAARSFPVNDVAAGREYVEAYVTFIHYVEGLHEAAAHPVEGHYPEGAGGAHHEK